MNRDFKRTAFILHGFVCVCVCVCNKVFTITFDTFNAIKYSIVKKSITFPMACMFFQMDFNTIACIQAACSRLNQPNTVLGNILHIIQQLVSVLDSEAKLVCVQHSEFEMKMQ